MSEPSVARAQSKSPRGVRGRERRAPPDRISQIHWVNIMRALVLDLSELPPISLSHRRTKPSLWVVDVNRSPLGEVATAAAETLRLAKQLGTVYPAQCFSGQV